MAASRNKLIYNEMEAQCAAFGAGELPPPDVLSRLPDTHLVSLVQDIYAYEAEAARPDHAEGWPAFIKKVD